MPNMPWAEYFIASPPGVPLAETRGHGTPLPEEGYLTPNPGPGFGLELEEEWLKPFWD
jgi:hypothetical protein